MLNPSSSSQPQLSQVGKPKQFKLLRNFSIVSLCGFVLTTGLISTLYRKQAVRNMAISTEESNVALTQVLSNTLWPEYKDFLISTESLSTQALVEAKETQEIQVAIAEQLAGLSVLKIKIYDLEGRTVFSTDPSQIGSVKKDSVGLSTALAGDVISQVDHRDTFTSIDYSVLEERDLLSSYIPIRSSEAASNIEGVIEVYTDVTPALARIRAVQRNSFLYSALILAVLYGVLITFVRKADRLISEQYQQVQASEANYKQQSEEIASVLADLKRTQAQMLHSEKMSGLGQMVAGVAHEINNPVNFIYGNLEHVDSYIRDIFSYLDLYEACNFQLPNDLQAQAEDLEIDFVREDLGKTLASMKLGTNRIRDIVLSLRTFSRLDEADRKHVDLHEGIESTLTLLQHRLKAKSDRAAIDIVRDYDQLPEVECYAGQINQVFMNILANAIDVLEETPARLERNITIRTEARPNSVIVGIANSGPAIPQKIRDKIFDPFFTTKKIGKGTGMGLAICHQLITENHKGKLECFSSDEVGTEFVVEIPLATSDRA